MNSLLVHSLYQRILSQKVGFVYKIFQLAFGIDFFPAVCYCFCMKDLLYDVIKIDSASLSEPLSTTGLQSDRQRRIAGMKRKEAISASLHGDWLARKLAAELVQCQPNDLLILDGEHGKPYLSGAEAEISISHSGAYSAAAAAFRPVGIDLERTRPLPKSVALRICSPEELHWVYAHTQLALSRFLRLWTMKEAYGKMLGVGIFSSQQFNASFVGETLIELYPDCLFLFPAAPEGYTLTVCIQREK